MCSYALLLLPSEPSEPTAAGCLGERTGGGPLAAAADGQLHCCARAHEPREIMSKFDRLDFGQEEKEVELHP